VSSAAKPAPRRRIVSRNARSLARKRRTNTSAGRATHVLQLTHAFSGAHMMRDSARNYKDVGTTRATFGAAALEVTRSDQNRTVLALEMVPGIERLVSELYAAVSGDDSVRTVPDRVPRVMVRVLVEEFHTAVLPVKLPVPLK